MQGQPRPSNHISSLLGVIERKGLKKPCSAEEVLRGPQYYI
jgi:hypothetical protein